MLTLATSWDLGGISFAVVGGAVFVVWIIMATVQGMVKRSAIEQSRREIAAYVAEGSMTPADAERLLTAEPKSMCGD
ncbi:MAG: hypothetical protein KF757_04270 [Phycisphaeraceae bacterium]|nr:hypothetical protein [Phycisphaeraceae bacterium]MCW5764190.1 hypothetical protein [Phycisphaeraceae bacterium]